MKRKDMKLFLVLGVVLLSLLASGCSPQDERTAKSVSASDIQNIIDYTHPESVQMTFYFDDKVRHINSGTYTFYTAEIKKENAYVVCGYIGEKDYLPERNRMQPSAYYEKVTWIRYDRISEVERNYNNLVLSDVYLVYDLVVKDDIIQGKSYNNSYKYYQNATYEFVNGLNTDSLVPHSDILLWYYRDLNQRENVCFGEYNYDLSYEIVYGDDGKIDVLFIKQAIYDDGDSSLYYLEKELGSCYAELQRYILDAETLKEKICLQDGSEYILEKVKVDMDVIRTFILGKGAI